MQEKISLSELKEQRKEKKQDNKENLRRIKMIPGFIKYADGSVLMQSGNTKVICNATIDEKVPPFLRDQGRGWVTAEYAMLPRATEVRTPRAITRGKADGRSVEIQRLIGRSLRAVIDFKKLGERTIVIDCDVIQADGGTRTASITGGFVALNLAIQKLIKRGKIKENPIMSFMGAVSVGIVKGEPVLDLCYIEDSNADVDMNVVMTENGKIIEIQGTAERHPFSFEQLNKLMGLAHKGIKELIEIQKKTLNSIS